MAVRRGHSQLDSRAIGSGLAAVRTDVRPIIPRVSQGVFQRTDLACDQIYGHATEALSRKGFNGHVLRARSLSHPSWVAIELWIPIQDDLLLTQRSSATVRISAMPYHRFEIVYDVEFDRCGRKSLIKGLNGFGLKEVEATVAYLVGEGPKPAFSNHQLRRRWWELWKPENKPSALSRDWLRLIPYVLGGLGFLSNLGHLLFWGGAIVVAWLLWRRPRMVRTSGRPMAEPRILVPIDSWQTVVFGGGPVVDQLRQHFVERLNKPMSGQLRWSPEQIWYWSLEGTIEREQIVLRLNRAIVFVHFHQHESALYVAWDAHLNRGQWVEKDLFQGIDRRSRQLAVIRVVEQGEQQLTEYDLTDVNCLLEWTHAQITQLVKQLMKELQIEQELDFKIIRGERKGVTGDERQKRPAIAGLGDLVNSVLRRTG